MKILKQLHDAVKGATRNSPELLDNSDLRAAMSNAHEFLCASKSFEYTGIVSIGTSNLIRLTDISTDFDDIVRMLGGRKSDIKLPCQIFVLVVDEDEIKRRHEAIEAATKGIAVAEPELPKGA